MNTLHRYAIVLSVYFNTRGFAFALFESPLSPVDWGVKEMRGSRKHARSLGRLIAIFNRYRPDILVIQDTSRQGTPRVQRIIRLNVAIAAMAKEREVAVYKYSRADVFDAFGYLGASNKQMLAEIIAKHIPAFERYVPPPRKPWKSEDARMGIFDATALALVFFQRTGGYERQGN